MADFLEAGKVPEIRKRAALIGLHWLHRTVVPVEENAFAVRLVLQCEALAVGAQTRELLNEIELAQPLERSQA